MAHHADIDPLSGVETTGHEWDGLQELNNPLPKWWLYVFFATVAWALVYWVLYPAWPLGSFHTKGLLGWTARSQIESDLAAGHQAQAKYLDRIAAATVEQIHDDPDLLNFALAGGRSAFAVNCTPCHGAGGQGNPNFPILADDKWLWGGTLSDIYQTIQHGIRAADDDTHMSQMPRFGADGVLKPNEINDVAEYVLSFTKKSTDAAAAGRGAQIFADNCAACHGDHGQGSLEVGAPALNDGIWQYGGDKSTIVQTVTYARQGVMPNWSKRLDDATIKQLAVYVHELGGGK
ncbi:MAG: cytochrome-c oxidase, cbb3-type subunit III [Azospirillum sp.]|nr:cytochrome-c oxidase, cbb3-type subunit III [Azospirillum sp.]